MSDILVKTLGDGIGELDLNLNEQQLIQLQQYYQLLIDTNKKVNLTAIVEPEEVAVKHFLDSLTCTNINELKSQKNLLDVGTGAGFPGIVLKIYNQKLNVTLLDSLQKRIDFLNNVIVELKLDNIRAIHGRAEDFGKNNDFREKFDIVVSRAVANLSVLTEYCLPFAKIDGFFIAMKTAKAQDEINNANNSIEVLGGVIDKIYDIKLPITGEERTLVKIKKIAPTPDKYPRKAGLPSKRPIKG